MNGLVVTGGLQQVVATWNSASNTDVENYMLSIRETGSTEMMSPTTLGPTSGTHTFSNLLNFTSYEVAVAAMCTQGGVGDEVRRTAVTESTRRSCDGDM